jgi:putative endonuclease
MGVRSYYVYILASRIGGTLYIGVTNDLVRRVYEHKSGAAEGFTKDYDVNRLAYFECFDDVEAAIQREKRLKKWTRAWKIAPGMNGEASGILGRPVKPGDDT